MVTIGIDVNALTRSNRTGVEWYVFSLVQAMMKQPLRKDIQVMLYASEVVDDLGPLPQGWEWRIIRWPLPKGWTHGRLSLELLFRTPNLFFSPGHEVPLLTGRTKIVSTVHDLAFLRRPDLYPPSGNRRQQWAIRHNTKRANRLIAISEVTKTDLMELLQIPGEKIDIVHLASMMQFDGADGSILKKHGLANGGYFLSVGRLERKKNSAFLIQAFDAWKRKTGGQQKLVLAGSPGWGFDAILQAKQQSDFSEEIIFTGYITQEEKVALLESAKAYCFPTSYEGFGLPLLEAWQMQVPAIVSDLPIFHELGEGAAYFAKEDDIAGWGEAFSKAVAGELQSLCAAGDQQLQTFSWDKTAKKTWDVLQSLYA